MTASFQIPTTEYTGSVVSIRISDVPGSNLGPDIGYPDLRVFMILLQNLGSATTPSFHAVSNSLSL
jgi:hypothetical protein